VAEPPPDRSSVAIAFQWATTVMTLAAEMVVPALIGYLLDQKFGTGHVLLLIGFALGGLLATLGLVRITKDLGSQKK
jgi:F0F1-type ATP synthase assembly protein I